MSEHQSFIKDKAECGCGCGAYGTLKPENRAGIRCVARVCKCAACRGRANRKRGLAKQRTAAKKLGLARGPFLASNEENWSDNMFRNEVKSDKLSAGPVGNAWLRCVAQIDANRPDFGDTMRHPRVTFMPPGWGSRGLVVVTTETWAEIVRPAMDEFYGSAT